MGHMHEPNGPLFCPRTRATWSNRLPIEARPAYMPNCPRPAEPIQSNLDFGPDFTSDRRAQMQHPLFDRFRGMVTLLFLPDTTSRLLPFCLSQSA